jgi:pimeloyl-ACP methyl ester carboxylesterase
VVGSSYGGYLATILTTMRPVKWLALRAPALYMDSGWEVPKLQLHKDQDLRAYRRSLVAARDNRALQACHDFDGDLLLVESELDTIVPRAVLSSYREAGKNARSLTYRCLQGADHGLARESDQRAYTSVLVGWLKEMVFGARAGTVMPADVHEPHEPEAPPSAPSLVKEPHP